MLKVGQSGGIRSPCGTRPIDGLKPGRPDYRCGQSNRTAAVGPRREWNHACGHSDGAAPARPTSRSPSTEETLGGAEHVIASVGGEGELRRIRLAHDDRAGALEADDQLTVLRRRTIIRMEHRAVGGDEADGVLGVLDADRDTCERADGFAAFHRGVDVRGRGQGRVAVDGNERV